MAGDFINVRRLSTGPSSASSQPPRGSVQNPGVAAFKPWRKFYHKAEASSSHCATTSAGYPQAHMLDKYIESDNTSYVN
jgi:hypothetical protein